MADHEPFIGITQDATVQALKLVSDNILLAVEALNIAVAALSTKTIKVDTDHVAINNFPVTQPVSGTVNISNPGITDTQLRAADVKVTLDGETVSINNFPATQQVAGTIAVSNPGITDTQLRAADIKVTLDSETVAINNFPATQPVSGTVLVSNMISQGLTDTQLRATDIKVTLDSEAVALDSATLAALETVSINNFPATQPVSLVSLPIPTGAALDATLQELKTSIDNLNAKVTAVDTGNVTMVNPSLTDAELRATAVPVSFSAGGIATDGTIEELQAIEQRLKLLNVSIQRLSFDATSQLRVLVSSLPTLSTVSTVSSVTTMVTGNIGLGDIGKPATAILASRQAFNASTGANFIRS